MPTVNFIQEVMKNASESRERRSQDVYKRQVQGEKGHDHRNDDLGGAFPNAGGRFAVILTHDFVQIGLHVTAAFSSGCSIYRRCRLAFLFKDAQRERPPLGLFCYRQ